MTSPSFYKSDPTGRNFDQDQLLPAPVETNTNLRWIVLALAGLTMLGNGFCFDNPQALQNYLVPYLGIKSAQFNMLYTSYHIPNLIMPFFTGAFVDYIGSNIAIVLLSFVVVIGQSIIAFGVYEASFTIMLIGRVVLGISAESLAITRSTIIANWFRDKELGFALGTGLSLLFASNALNSFLSPLIYEATGKLHLPFVLGIIICGFSFFVSLSIYKLDTRSAGNMDEIPSPEGERKSVETKAKRLILEELKKFGQEYYVLIISSFFLYGALFGLRDDLNDILVEKFFLTPSEAGFLILFLYLCPTILTPFMGIMLDRSKRRILIVLAFTVLFVLETAFLTFADDSLMISQLLMLPGLMIIGLFHATFAAMFWSSIPRVLGTKSTGLAYGIAIMLQNMVQSSVPVMLGYIHDNTLEINHGYFWSLVPLLILGVIGIFILIWLHFIDVYKGGKLNRANTYQETELTKL